MSTTLGKFAYVRSHGLGNDYLVVDAKTLGFELTEARIRQICGRNQGVGSDGILARVPPPAGFDEAVRIFNPDGSEAEKSGNGVRIFAKFCFDAGYSDGKKSLRIHTLGGPVTAHLVAREANRSVLRVSMGQVSFRAADLPMTSTALAAAGPEAEWVEQPLEVGDKVFRVTCVSVGNPHVVVFDAPFSEAAAKAYGPLIEHHAHFPRRTNTQFVRVIDRSTVEALIWERGAGWTLSSGSSSCAVAAACVRAGLVDRELRVKMPGGTLEVAVGENWSLEQVGHAQEICRGVLSSDLLSSLGVAS